MDVVAVEADSSGKAMDTVPPQVISDDGGMPKDQAGKCNSQVAESESARAD